MLAQNPAQDIDEVIARLTDIIDVSRREPGRLGYFAALYRKVTISVKPGTVSKSRNRRSLRRRRYGN